MSQKAIWKIVLLVSTALIGIFGMQVYAIISTFQLNSELFDGNVHNALDHIVSKLEQKELQQSAELYNLPRLTKVLPKNTKEVASLLEVEEISRFISNENSKNAQITNVDTLNTDEIEVLTRNFKTTENIRVWSKGGNKDYMVHF